MSMRPPRPDGRRRPSSRRSRRSGRREQERRELAYERALRQQREAFERAQERERQAFEREERRRWVHFNRVHRLFAQHQQRVRERRQEAGRRWVLDRFNASLSLAEAETYDNATPVGRQRLLRALFHTDVPGAQPPSARMPDPPPRSGSPRFETPGTVENETPTVETSPPVSPPTPDNRYQPSTNLGLRPDAYSPITIDSDDDADTIILEHDNPEEPVPSRPLPLVPFSESLESPARPPGVDPPRHEFQSGNYYLAFPGATPDDPPIIVASNQLVADLLNTCHSHEFEFIGPRSTVVIREL